MAERDIVPLAGLEAGGFKPRHHFSHANSHYILCPDTAGGVAKTSHQDQRWRPAMASASDWKVPATVQPKPRDYAYDLDAALSAVVGVRSIIPGDAFSAETLGTERAGNGVLIRKDGLVLTIGYLITEAETIWLTLSDGRAVPG